ncbi:hypothetical protein F4561_003766 [Lipingzhangella halophila]|uniref:Uncharacterized protein n=1 Tax=Lipingzhangella halophila TaxID=1783352 RepID=A0A7W7RJ58_9ACTN|nr:hypothetical protein [Lipingzhangella halophila]MBB4932946.1 hypothetical protein [Lipingzhangella halophila]
MTETGHAVAQLRALAGELEAHVRRNQSTDQLAYAQLLVDGERHPWTLAAQRTWEKGGGAWRDHHRAISYHARAYDLEQQGKAAEAHKHWLGALRCWARLADSDDFWERMRAHLAEAMGAEPPGELVESVRARLPRDLLEPNLTRAVELRASQPEQARMHMTAVRESGLSPEAVAKVRREFAEEITKEAVRDAQAGRYDAGVSAIEASLTADPTNPRLVEVLLYVVRQTVPAVSAEKGWAHLSGFLDRIERLVQPYIEETGSGTQSAAAPEIVRELARFEFFRGVQRRALMMDTQENPATAVGHAGAAVTHLKRALAHDPDLTDDGAFHEAQLLLTQQSIYAAYFTQLTHRGDTAVRAFLSPALRALGTRPNPEEGQPELAPLVIAHMSAPHRSEVRRGQAVAAHLLNHPDTPQQKRGMLSETRSLLSLREGTLR